jgi:hypothetical protein
VAKTYTRHKGCGGRVEHRVCSKCGKKWSKLRYLVASDLETVAQKFDEQAYRDRIRNLRDI